MTTSVPVTNAGEIFTGRVKWFNNKAGFGFITVTDGPRSGSDIFVHHSAIKVDAEQYKYLVQGEYVEFSLVSTSGGAHEIQAANVCGIKGGKLMCETRREFRTARNNYRETSVSVTDNEISEPVKMPRSVRAPSTNSRPKVRGQGPRESGEWSYQGRQRDTQSSQSQSQRRPKPRTVKTQEQDI